MENTPIIIGVGQVTESVPDNLSIASSHADLAGKAALAALVDAKGKELSTHIDVIATVKIFSDSLPTAQAKTGRSNNFPRSVANRIRANPKLAIYEAVGGDSPQRLVNEFMEKLAAGSCEMVLIAGGEALANVKAAKKQKVSLDWSEEVAGQLEDRGISSGKLGLATGFQHQLVLPMQYYGLMENARRGRIGANLEDYTLEMAEEFSKLSEVAVTNPYAAFPTAYEANFLATSSKENSLIISPYTKRLMANDRVNQGAAILMTTVGKAKELGIEEDKWVYLHGYAQANDPVLLERPNMGQSQGMKKAVLSALKNANKNSDDIRYFDIYSCFPIVVSEARQVLGIAKDDPRSLTQTGGLPYFGGPGNNYMSHAICSLVTALRKDATHFGLAYGNGGWLSKHAAAIYSATPTQGNWQPQPPHDYPAQEKIAVTQYPKGLAILETYTIHYFKGFPVKAIIIGRLKDTKERFYATTPMGDTRTVQELAKGDSIGRMIHVEPDPKGNRFAFDLTRLAKHRPKVIQTFKENYKFTKIERKGWILKIIINRPEVRNALHPPANEELVGIFNAFEKDDSLRVAILTGFGTESFSAGNDLKYMSSGNPIWIPNEGFAGLTNRTNRVKPIIAAVNGMAVGGGLEIAMACDIIVAADHALFGLPEVKIGLVAAAGGVQRLPRMIGKKLAMEMMLTGQPINCEKALEHGLINYAVPSNQLMKKSEELAYLITQASPVAVRSTMQLYKETSKYANTDDAVNAPNTIFDTIVNSDDFWEGARSCSEKRKPKWTQKS